MSLRRLLVSAVLPCLGLWAATSRAALLPLGSPAPGFTKNVLNSDPWPTATLSQFSGKVLILHILGYS